MEGMAGGEPGMAEYREPIAAGLAAPRRAWALSIVCVAILAALVFATSSGADPATGQDPRTGVTVDSRTRYRGWMPHVDGEELLIAANSGEITPDMSAYLRPDVRCNEFIRLNARVRELDGRPTADAAVKFEWRSGDDVIHMSASTDEQGNASVRRWVSGKHRGKPTVVVVTVDTASWSASRYAWFVPE
jgi:hypothetical protein